jgi:hypothetical protein
MKTLKTERRNIKNLAKMHMKSLQVAFERFARGSDAEIDYAREKFDKLGEDLHQLIAKSH